MLEYANMSTKSQPRRQFGVWMLVLGLLLLSLALTVVALLIQTDPSHTHGDQPKEGIFIISHLWSRLKAPANETGDEIAATVERIAREAKNASYVPAARQSKNYYEEQNAVVVNSESAQPAQAERQFAFDAQPDRSDEYDAYGAEDYGSQPTSEEQYSDSSRSATSNEKTEGRAAQGSTYDSYYGQWQYAGRTPAPGPATAGDSNNRKLQAASNRPPYPAYDEVYDYPMGFQRRPQEQAVSKQAVVPAQGNPLANVQQPTESTLVTVLKSLKQLFDLYQALTSAWSAVSERHQQSDEQLKKERLEKQRLRQQQQQQQKQKTRVNSKKPPRVEGDKLAKKTKASSTTTSTSSTTLSSDDSEEATTAPTETNTEKETANERSLRDLRQKREPESASTDVGEGRYIKGDPLKGYYDFVITEGSYKFWAVFQVGTALLIIYSTFAAIYYSKVNPLTSDYDYQDYLGAGRSLSGGDDDFVDDSDTTTATASTSTTSRLMDWVPRTAHSLQFILDAIDKIPLDHDQHKENGWSSGSSNAAASAETPAAKR